MAMPEPIWTQPQIVTRTQILLDSYQQRLGKPLIARSENPIEEAKAVFFAPFVVVSHGTEADPILNYGNQIALDLWEMTWEKLTQTPSRLTAEPMNREEREKMLRKAAKQGFIDSYRGVRISSTGRRFAIERAIIWNLERGGYCGQAATFSVWSFL